MGNVIEAVLRLMAVDRTGPGLRSAQRNLTGFRREVASLHSSMGPGGSGLFGGPLVKAMGGLIAFETARRAAVALADAGIDVDRQLKAIKVTAGATAAEMETFQRKMQLAAGETQTSSRDLASSAGDLVAAGLDLGTASASVGTIAKGAKASGAALGEMNQAAIALIQNLGFTPDTLMTGIDEMIKGGKAGMFEMKDMAREFPAMAASASKLGMKGADGLAQIVAMAQIVRQSTATGAEAAVDINNFLGKLAAPDTKKNLKKFGVDVEAVFKRAKASGKDFTHEMLLEIQRVTKGDPFKISQIFGDVQANAGVSALLKDLGALDGLIEKIKNSAGETMRDFAERTDGASAAVDHLAASWRTLLDMSGKKLNDLSGPTAEKVASTIDRIVAGQSEYDAYFAEAQKPSPDKLNGAVSRGVIEVALAKAQKEADALGLKGEDRSRYLTASARATGANVGFQAGVVPPEVAAETAMRAARVIDLLTQRYQKLPEVLDRPTADRPYGNLSDQQMTSVAADARQQLADLEGQRAMQEQLLGVDAATKALADARASLEKTLDDLEAERQTRENYRAINAPDPEGPTNSRGQTSATMLPVPAPLPRQVPVPPPKPAAASSSELPPITPAEVRRAIAADPQATVVLPRARPTRAIDLPPLPPPRPAELGAATDPAPLFTAMISEQERKAADLKAFITALSAVPSGQPETAVQATRARRQAEAATRGADAAGLVGGERDGYVAAFASSFGANLAVEAGKMTAEARDAAVGSNDQTIAAYERAGAQRQRRLPELSDADIKARLGELDRQRADLAASAGKDKTAATALSEVLAEISRLRVAQAERALPDAPIPQPPAPPPPAADEAIAKLAAQLDKPITAEVTAPVKATIDAPVTARLEGSATVEVMIHAGPGLTVAGTTARSSGPLDVLTGVTMPHVQAAVKGPQ